MANKRGADPSAMRSSDTTSGGVQSGGAIGDDARRDTSDEATAQGIERRNEKVSQQQPGAWLGSNSGQTPFGTAVDNDKQADDAAHARNEVVTEPGGPLARGVNPRIYAAIGQLDMHNDDHWTDDGLPRIDAVQKLMGVDPRSDWDVTRDAINLAAPGFTRTVAPFQGATDDLETKDDMNAKSEAELIAGDDNLAKANNYLNWLYVNRDDLAKHIADVERERDKILTRHAIAARANPQNKFAETRRFLDQQHADRMARAGVNPDHQQRSPIDQRMGTRPNQQPQVNRR